MKFLVLALCVCAASAASFSPYGRYNTYKQAGNAVVGAPQAVAQAAVTGGAPFVTPVAKAAAQVYESAPQVVNAAAQVYQSAPQVAKAAAQVYQPASQVVTKNVNYNKDAEASIVRSESEVNADGYRYVYETANGISGESSGAVKRVGDTEVLAVQGAYRYLSPEGVPVVVTYVADENGYQPQSDLLPVAPPVPEAIARSLIYIRDHPQVSENYKKY